MKDRRVIALEVSIARCERFVETQRRALVAQRLAIDAQTAQCRLAEAQHDAARSALAACMAQLNAMTGGEGPFSVERFNEQRRYLEVVAERERLCGAESERQRDVLTAMKEGMQQTRNLIAQSEARAGFVRKQATAIQRAIQHRAEDLADDEAQESATARMRSVQNTQVRAA